MTGISTVTVLFIQIRKPCIYSKSQSKQVQNKDFKAWNCTCEESLLVWTGHSYDVFNSMQVQSMYNAHGLVICTEFTFTAHSYRKVYWEGTDSCTWALYNMWLAILAHLKHNQAYLFQHSVSLRSHLGWTSLMGRPILCSSPSSRHSEKPPYTWRVL